MNTFEALVSLNSIPQVGSVCLGNLLKYFKAPEDIFEAPRTDLAHLVGENIAESILSFNCKQLEKDLFLARKSTIRIITFLDNDYPQVLKEIPSAPIVLYILGDIIAEDKLAVGIVGARRASFYGLTNAEKFGADLASRAITVVSGLARGVDTYAHKGALKAGGRTIAIMGSGFSNIYPSENEDLARQISLSGAVISEFPMQTQPLPINFPRRNRIISGLSLGVLVTEAARNSGALITADFALEQGREVFALPGRIDSASSSGTNELLKQGAKLVTNCQDILEELNLVEVNAVRDTPVRKYSLGCVGDENIIYQAIGKEVVAIDELVEKTSLPSSQIYSLILKLQFKKLIKELPGKHFMRNN